jgi:hypothetical protein
MVALQINGQLHADSVMAVVVSFGKRNLRASACMVATGRAWLNAASVASGQERIYSQWLEIVPQGTVGVHARPDVLQSKFELATMICSDVKFHFDNGASTVLRQDAGVAKTQAAMVASCYVAPPTFVGATCGIRAVDAT